MRHLALVGALALAILTGCGGGGDTTPTPDATEPPAPTSTVAVTPTVAVTLGDIVFSNAIDEASGGPASPTESFARSTPTVHAFVQSGALPAGTTIRVEWSINGVAVPTLMQDIVLNDGHPGGWLEFNLTLTDGHPWPSGLLGVTITVDGAVQATGSAQLTGF